MVELNLLKEKNCTLKVGKKVFYQAKVHSSVGIEVSYEVSDKTIIALETTELDYKNKENKQLGMAGADEATKTFVLKALKKGEANLIFTEEYRGETGEVNIFKIMVE